MTTILIVDDEPQIRRFLRISLSSQGYSILEAENGRDALAIASVETPNLIILDLGLPDTDGKMVLTRLREFYAGPVIVLSVRYEESEKVATIDAGANDYVVKPFGVKELLARIRSLLKLFEGMDSVSAIFDDGNLYVDMLNRQVRVAGHDIKFSRKEFELLKMLIAHPGRIITQQQLLKEVWGPGHGDDSQYLRIFIGKIRAKLGDDPANPTYIETEPGVGYRFLTPDGCP